MLSGGRGARPRRADCRCRSEVHPQCTPGVPSRASVPDRAPPVPDPTPHRSGCSAAVKSRPAARLLVAERPPRPSDRGRSRSPVVDIRRAGPETANGGAARHPGQASVAHRGLVRHHGAVATDPTPVLMLAGGASRRMGHDKRVALIDGVPMLLRAIERLAPSPTIVIIDPRHSLSLALPENVRVIPDSRPGEGPLAALEAGLRALTQDIVLVVAADMPRIEPSVLRLLVSVSRMSRDGCRVPRGRGPPRPLPLALRRAPVLARLSPLLDAGERRLRALLDGARACCPPNGSPSTPRCGTLHDVDTPADLAAVR